MRIENQAETTPVYGRSGYPQFTAGIISVTARRCVTLVLAFMLAVAMAGTGMARTAFADDPTPSTAASQPASDADAIDANSGYILDTQNLLGNDMAKVSDAITRTREQTGVQVRLIYVDSFNSTESPDAWARETLKSLDPAPTTVLLAVATNAGNLAVVVSPDSDEWLRSQQSVDALSEAASAPLTGVKAGESPDWAKSAIDMMDVIQREKSTSTSQSAVMIGIIALIAVVAVAAVAVGVVIVQRRRKEVDTDAATSDMGMTANGATDLATETTADDADAAINDADTAADDAAADDTDPHVAYKQ